MNMNRFWCRGCLGGMYSCPVSWLVSSTYRGSGSTWRGGGTELRQEQGQGSRTAGQPAPALSETGGDDLADMLWEILGLVA